MVARMQEPSPSWGYYVYGVLAGAPAGLDLGAGLGTGAPVGLLAGEGMSAIVSAVPLEGFTPEAVEARLADLAWVEAQVRAHQSVLARAQAHGALAPLRFGTVYRDAAGVRAMLAEQGPRLRAALDRLAGRQEWGLKITVDAARLAEQAAAESPRLRQLDEQLRGMAAGAAYLLAKKRAQLLREECAQAADRCARHCHERLAARAALAVASGGAGPAAQGQPELILNGAYLVDEAGVDGFIETVRELAVRFGGFGFDLSGPWPAYNFVGAAVEDAGA